ncbi:MAG: nitroreductase family protein [Alistipes sp.]|nr:nitroreductase family protein [Alistipes sp.]
MEFKEIIRRRRSVRKFDGRPVPREVVGRVLEAALGAPSSRNSRSTRFLAVDDPAAVARMAEMRDYGAGFMKGAPMAIVVLGDAAKTDLWRENCAIAATLLQLACVDEGLASCWVHVDGRPRLKDAPDGETATDYLRTLLPLPEGCEPLCVIAMGYSDFVPAPLPEADDAARVTWLEGKVKGER